MLNMDEARNYKDILHVMIGHGDDVSVPLSALGTGQVLTCADLVGGLDFGDQFTGAPMGVLI